MASIFVAFGPQSLCLADDNMIYACYKEGNGLLRITDNAGQCLPSEYPIKLYSEQIVPNVITVNCEAGETVTDALAQAPVTGHLTINIIGVCQESVTITRDDITLQGDSPGAGLQSSSDVPLLLLDGARRVLINQLTLTGGNHGLFAHSGASFHAYDLHVQNNTHYAGIHITMEASGRISNSIIEGSGIVTWGSGSLYVFGGEVRNSDMFGVQASGGSYINLDGGFRVVGSRHHAVFAGGGGSIDVHSAIIEDNLSAGVWAMDGSNIGIIGNNTRIENNNGGVVAWSASSVSIAFGAQVINNQGHGVQADYGGNISVSDGAVINNNSGAGLSLSGGSAARIHGSYIVDNEWNGIYLNDISVASFGLDDPNQITGNGGHGIECQTAAPAVAQITGNPGDVSGNALDPQINCP
jgi:hypothetical protein